MASNYGGRPAESASPNYGTIVGFWRTRWFWSFVALEVLFFGGGYLLASLGSPSVGFAAGPDAYLAMGGVMGSLGIATAVLWAGTIALSVWFRYRREFEREVEF